MSKNAKNSSPPRSRAASRSTASAGSAPKPGSRPASQPLVEAVMYTRVSSKDQEKEGFSIPAQQRLLSAYAERMDIAVVAEFVDVETAKQSGREQFGEMLKYLKKRPSCRAILVEKTDRLYRNIKDFVTLDEMELDLHFVKEGSVVGPDSRSSDKFMHGIRVVVAKNYVDVLSEEAKKGMLEKARQGIWPSRAPLGYKNVVRPDGKKVIDVDPEVAPKVVRLFEDYATGQYSVKALTKRARVVGLAYPNSGNAIARTTLHQILQNPLYMGEFDWHDVRYKGIHRPLITPELFEKVQEAMSDRATNCRHEQKRDFAFSGLVYCGKCWDEGHKRMLIGSLIKKQYIYYHCERCKELKRNKYVRERLLDEGFEAALKRVAVSPAALDLVKRSLLAAHALVRDDRDSRVMALQAEYDRLTKKIDAAYEDRLEGRIDIDFFDRKAREWREQQARIRRDLANVEAADEGALRTGLDLFELLRELPDRYATAEAGEKRRLLGRTASNSVWRDAHLEVTLRKVYQLLENLPAHPEKANAPGGIPEGVPGQWLPLTDHRKNVQCHHHADWPARPPVEAQRRRGQRPTGRSTVPSPALKPRPLPALASAARRRRLPEPGRARPRRGRVSRCGDARAEAAGGRGERGRGGIRWLAPPIRGMNSPCPSSAPASIMVSFSSTSPRRSPRARCCAS